MDDTNSGKATSRHNVSIVIIELILGLSELRSFNNIGGYWGLRNFS